MLTIIVEDPENMDYLLLRQIINLLNDICIVSECKKMDEDEDEDEEEENGN